MGQSVPIPPAKKPLPAATVSDRAKTVTGGTVPPSVNDTMIAMIEVLSALLANGHACGNWLASQPANLDRVRASIDLVLRDGDALAILMVRMQHLLADVDDATSLPGSPLTSALPISTD
jgi:hypothetical protein